MNKISILTTTNRKILENYSWDDLEVFTSKVIQGHIALDLFISQECKSQKDVFNLIEALHKVALCFPPTLDEATV